MEQRTYTVEFKLKVLDGLREGYTYGELGRMYGIGHHTVSEWAKTLREKGVKGLEAQTRKRGIRLKSEAPLLSKQENLPVEDKIENEGFSVSHLERIAVAIEFLVTEIHALREEVRRLADVWEGKSSN